MKANELMIGDWVRIEGKPFQVTQINNKSVPSEVGTYPYEEEDIYPIPLTPEILEKNGFVREENIQLYNHYTGIDNRVSLNDDFYCMNSRNMWDVHIDSEDYCTIANCELTYLHELQHLLKLVKIDFEFNV